MQKQMFWCLCGYTEDKPKRRLCLHTFIITFLIVIVECLNKHFFCLLDNFSKKSSVYICTRKNNNGINRRHSEQSFGHMTIFIHKFSSGILCTVVPFSHKKKKHTHKKWLYKMKEIVQKQTKKIYYTISLVVYIYYKCTIWLQYK